MDRWTNIKPVSPSAEEPVEQVPLSGEQKARLMKLALQESSPVSPDLSEDEKSELLLDILNSRIPIHESAKTMLPQVLIPLSGKLQSLTGKRIGEMLTDFQTPLSLLMKIHDFSKQAAAVSKSEIEKDIFFVVYCGSIASGLLNHSQKITQHDINTVRDYLIKLSKETWVPTDIKTLFSKAISQYQEDKSLDQ